MKNKEILSIVLAVAAIILALVAIAKPTELRVNDEQSAQITVDGEAERFVTPDTASISFTLTRKSLSLEDARTSVDERVAAILDTVKEDGIKESDVKTTNFSVRPEYDYRSGRQIFNGYRVSQTLELTIREIDTASVVVGKVGQLQVDNVSSLNFYVEDDKEIRAELREEAIKDAKQKAKALARDLGVELKEIISFSEGGGDTFYPQPVFRGIAFEEAESADFAPASLPTGENEYSSNVSITYSIGK